KAIACDRAKQRLDPPWFDISGIRGNDGTRAGLQQLRGGQDCMQRKATRRTTGILCADAMQSAESIDVRGMLQIADGSGANQFLAAIARATVRVDDDGALPGEVFQQTGTDRLHDLTYRLRVVVRRHADENVDLTDVNQFTKKIIRQNGFFGQNAS